MIRKDFVYRQNAKARWQEIAYRVAYNLPMTETQKHKAHFADWNKVAAKRGLTPLLRQLGLIDGGNDNVRI